MKINIVFFTSTGNSFFLALRAKYFFEKMTEHRVGMYDVVTSNYEEVINCDALGIFYPVWMSDMPDHLQNFCKRLLKDSVKKNIFIVGNCASGTDNSQLYWKRKLERAGHKVNYAAMLKMPSNFNISLLARDASEVEINELKERAVVNLQEICSDISAGVTKNLSDGLASKLYAIQRLFFYFKSKWGYKYMKLAESRCTKCQMCVKLCPMENIKPDGNGNISFGKKCIMCAKCFNYCPTNAVLIGKKSEDASKYHRYFCKEIKPIFYR